ncbi:MAG: hypothetical protein WBX01_08830 [Nitrososphaeraceae archaeon]
MAIHDIPKGLGIMTGILLLAGSLTAVMSTSEGNGLANAYPKDGQGYRHDFGMMKGMLKPGEYASGTIASMQNDENGNPTWLVSGNWEASMTDGKYATGDNATESAKFIAAFDMAMTNGSAQHQHKIYNFTLANMSMPDNSTMVIDGTVTVTMRDGPVQNVPVTVTVMEGNVISISMDPNMVNSHFGDTPIYGIVKKAISIMK